LPPNPDNGREQSTVSWEYDFEKKDSHASYDESGFHHISIPWHVLKPTYRGKAKLDAEPLAKDSIKRMSIMMRRYVSLLALSRALTQIGSFFGTQQGDFCLNLVAIGGMSPLRSPDTTIRSRSRTDGKDDSSLQSFDKSTQLERRKSEQIVWSRFFCWSSKV